MTADLPDFRLARNVLGKSPKKKVYKDLEKLMEGLSIPVHFPKPIVVPPSKQPRLFFDAERFRWLFGTPAGRDFLNSTPNGGLRTLQGWRDLIDKEMLKCDDRT